MSLSFEIKSSALPQHATVTAFRGSEGISRPYVFDVYVNVIGNDEVEIDDAPGSRATLVLHDPHGLQPIRFDGMIAALELLRSVHDKSHATNTLYRVRIVPNLWQLSLTKHSRIWTQKTIPDIIKEVLEDEGVSRVDMRLHGSYDTEEHVCQYKESSLNFIDRWMEREGMYYFFEQSEDGETLVITDDKSSAGLSRLLPIPYHPTGGDSSSGAHLDMFTWKHAALPTSVEYVEYDYTKPKLEVKGKSDVSPIGVGEQVTWAYRFFSSKQGNALAKVRAEDLRAQAKTFHGSGPVTGISSGFKFAVENHPKLQMNIEYLAVTVEHFGSTSGAASWGKAIPLDHSNEMYRVDVVAIDANQQYRHPEVASWPHIDGTENAWVDGPATSDYAQIDSHGRYNVKFHFDEGTLKNGKASTWVRKMQPHAGTVEGWHFPERAGTEVIIAFIGGDPDRPLIIGAIPTAIHPSPVTAANHTKNVIQTGGLNRFEFEDQAGNQRITMQTPTQSTHIIMGDPVGGDHFIARTQGNSYHHTDGDHDTYVGANHTELVEAELKQTVEAAVTHTFNSTQTKTVIGDVVAKYMSTHQETIIGNVVQTYMANHTHEILGQLEHSVTGDVIENYLSSHKKQIAVDMEEQIEANHKLTIGGMFKNAVNGIVDWTFNSAKSEKVVGAVNNVFLGLKSEFTGGVKIDTTIGAKIDLMAGLLFEAHAGPGFRMGPELTEIKLARTGLHVSLTRMASVEDKLGALETKVNGLVDETKGLCQQTMGMNEQSVGLISVEAGLKSVMAGLVSLA